MFGLVSHGDREKLQLRIKRKSKWKLLRGAFTWSDFVMKLSSGLLPERVFGDAAHRAV